MKNRISNKFFRPSASNFAEVPSADLKAHSSADHSPVESAVELAAAAFAERTAAQVVDLADYSANCLAVDDLHKQFDSAVVVELAVAVVQNENRNARKILRLKAEQIDNADTALFAAHRPD